MDATEQIVFPFYGYAPGGYLVVCPDCHQQFMGDKRARRCLPCARHVAWDDAQAFRRHERDLEANWL